MSDFDPVVGDAVEVDAVQPSVEQAAASRDRAKSRTAQQAFQATMILTPIIWLLRLNGIDLNPLAEDTEIPNEVVLQLGALVTYLAAVWMNRSRS